MDKKICLLAVNGCLGGGFKEETFMKALEEHPDVIAADSGSTDPGPFFLGEGKPRMDYDSCKWELRLMLREGVKRGIPVVIGSAGTAGADANVDWLVSIVREVAAEEKLHFKLGVIKTELTPEILRDYIRKDKMHPLNGAPHFEEKDLDTLSRCVAVIGAEPYVKVLNDGAQVIIAGRSSDTAIYAAVPIYKGLENGNVWHAGKLLECGAACCVARPYNDCMLAWVSEKELFVEPPNPVMKCTPVSCAAHTLYENADPFHLVEPGGCLNTEKTQYEQVTPRGVRITGSRFIPADQYTIKIEGAKFLGYRRGAIAGVNDPLVLKQLNSFLERAIAIAKKKIAKTRDLKEEDYLLRYEIYGNPSAENPGRIGVLFDVIAPTPEDADSIIASVWHIGLHTPIPEWQGHQSNLAFPFSPPSFATLNEGKTYAFCLNHVLDVDDPLELVRFEYEEF